MSRIYSVTDPNLTLGTGNVLFAARTAADAATAAGRIALRRIEIGQSGTTTGEMIRVAISERDTAGTLTMTSATARALSPYGGPASGLTGNTAPAGGAGRVGTDSSADSGGTYTDIYTATFHNLNGWLWVPTPEDRIEIPAAKVITVRLMATPTGTTGWHITVVFEELD